MYKKIMGGMFIATILLAGTIQKDVKKKTVTEPEGATSLNFITAAPPSYSTQFTWTYVDTMPNQYSTLYTAEKPINTSPDQSCIFAAFRRFSTDPGYPGSGWVGLVFSNDGGNTWNLVWPVNDSGLGRYPQVGPWLGNCDTFIVHMASLAGGYGAFIATVSSDLSSGNIGNYFFPTSGTFVGFQSFAHASNDLTNYVNWMISHSINSFTHWWWRFGFVDPDPPTAVIPNAAGGIWNMDYLGGTLAALAFPYVYFSYDDGLTWADSVELNSNIPIDTTQDGHVVDAIWYTNWWDFALLDASTPLALVTTTCMFNDPYVFGGTDTLWAAEGVYLLTPTNVYTVIDPDEGLHVVNAELTIDHVNNVLYVTYVAYHTLDWVSGTRYGWTDVYVKYSTDGGATWSAPINITRDEANQPTDDKIEQQVHTVKHIWGGDKIWMLFNVPVGWDGSLAGFDIHYDVFVNGGVTPSYIMIGYIPLLGVEESATPRVSIAGLKFNGNVVKNGLLKFFSPVNGKVSFELFDVNGRKVVERNVIVKAGNNELRFNSLKKGVYFLKYAGTAEGSVKLVFTK